MYNKNSKGTGCFPSIQGYWVGITLACYMFFNMSLSYYSIPNSVLILADELKIWEYERWWWWWLLLVVVVIVVVVVVNLKRWKVTGGILSKATINKKIDVESYFIDKTLHNLDSDQARKQREKQNSARQNEITL